MARTIRFKRLSPAAKTPEHQTERAAGFDLAVHAVFSTDDTGAEVRRDLPEGARVALAPFCAMNIGTGIALDMSAIRVANSNPCVLLVPRSSMGRKGLRLLNTVGVIDADYQGELILAVRNESNTPLELEAGQRIAQGILTLAASIVFCETLEFAEATERGAGGFGSTGS